MSSFRSALAGLLLAVVLCGGVGVPLVHEAMHDAEYAASRDAHDADGHHHGPDAADGETHLRESCPTPTPLRDLVCTLCHGLTAGLAVQAEAHLTEASAPVVWHALAARPSYGDATEPAGRGPPSVA